MKHNYEILKKVIEGMYKIAEDDYCLFCGRSPFECAGEIVRNMRECSDKHLDKSYFLEQSGGIGEGAI